EQRNGLLAEGVVECPAHPLIALALPRGLGLQGAPDFVRELNALGVVRQRIAAEVPLVRARVESDWRRAEGVLVRAVGERRVGHPRGDRGPPGPLGSGTVAGGGFVRLFNRPLFESAERRLPILPLPFALRRVVAWGVTHPRAGHPLLGRDRHI